MSIAMNTPIWQLTVGEFLELQKGLIPQNPVKVETKKKLLYGISGLADFLNCSKNTAQKIKSSGILDDAISQCGRTIIFDGDMVMKIMKEGER